jgi:hypothetical protein
MHESLEQTGTLCKRRFVVDIDTKQSFAYHCLDAETFQTFEQFKTYQQKCLEVKTPRDQFLGQLLN